MFTSLHIDSTAYYKKDGLPWEELPIPNSIKNFFPLQSDPALQSTNHYIVHRAHVGWFHYKHYMWQKLRQPLKTDALFTSNSQYFLVLSPDIRSIYV